MPSFAEWRSSYLSGWRKSFDYESKSSRLDCISFDLIFILIYAALSVAKHLSFSLAIAFIDFGIFSTLLQFLSQIIQIILFFFLLGTFIATISLSVRRLRDMGKKWWWVFWSFIPFINLIFSIWLFMQSPGNSERVDGEKADSEYT